MILWPDPIPIPIPIPIPNKKRAARRLPDSEVPDVLRGHRLVVVPHLLLPVVVGIFFCLCLQTFFIFC